jgi:hypothetical protein
LCECLFLTGFSNVSFTIANAFGQGNKIVKHWNFKGTHTGDFFGILATGKIVDIDGVTLVTMKDSTGARFSGQSGVYTAVGSNGKIKLVWRKPDFVRGIVTKTTTP